MPSPTHIQLLAAPWHVPESAALLSKARHWYRADTAITSGANLTALTNRGKAGGQLNVTAGTIAAPAADAALNGAPSFALTGTQYLVHSMPASEWTFLHNGAGGEVFVVMVPTVVAGTGAVVGTGDLSTYQKGATLHTSNAFVSYRVNKAGSSVVSATNGSMAAGVGTVLDAYYSASAVPAGMVSERDAVGAQAVQSTAPDTSAPFFPLYVGANPATLGQMLRARIAEIIAFDEVLGAYPRRIIREYVQRRYGIAAAVLPYDDRQVLRLNPFSWLRADSHIPSAGNVGIFTDKAMPGHNMDQTTPANRIPLPVADAAFGGRLVATFPGASSHRYPSNFPAATWAFLHSGAGATVAVIAAPAADAVSKWLLATMYGDYPTEYGYVFSFDSSTAYRNLAYGNVAGGDNLGHQQGTITAFTTPSLYINDLKPFTGAGQSFADTYRMEALLTDSIDSTKAAPPANAPATTLQLGNRADGYTGTNFAGKVADVLLFKRRLSAAERAALSAYAQSHYGLLP